MKTASRKEGEIKTFSEDRKLRESTASRSILEESEQKFSKCKGNDERRKLGTLETKTRVFRRGQI